MILVFPLKIIKLGMIVAILYPTEMPFWHGSGRRYFASISRDPSRYPWRAIIPTIIVESRTRVIVVTAKRKGQ